ncbi:MAG: putative 4-hydroxybenzoate polyprenyltransferase [Salinivirgaceae bacterium]|nr:putative 4-hydroxybenzoate polyprenyltransferase [Salinivirgaceae bacterium]
MFGKIQKYLSLVKFAHTIFALPFALVGFFMATTVYDYGFQWIDLLKVLLAMVFARNAAMGFNRLIDSEIDADNHRTANREIPAGKVSVTAARVFVGFNVAAFIATTWFINSLCFYLSFVAMIVVLGYSLTKRFTWLCHFILGVGLALAPIGAFLSVSGEFRLPPVLLSVAVLLWVAGFDIIYALQDEDFDKEHHLFSLPAYLGTKRAMLTARISHLFSFALVVIVGFMLELNFVYFVGNAVFGGMLLYQHTIVKPHDLSRINVAFFTTNGVASIVYATFFTISIFI